MSGARFVKMIRTLIHLFWTWQTDLSNGQLVNRGKLSNTKTFNKD